MSKYTIVGFTYSEMQRDLEFQRHVIQAAEETMRILAQSPSKLHDATRVDIRIDPELAHRNHTSIYYLDDAAMMMCDDLGFSPPVIGTTQGDLRHLGTLSTSLYLPKVWR